MQDEKEIADQQDAGLFRKFKEKFPEGECVVKCHGQIIWEYAYNLGRKHEREIFTKDAK